MRVPPCGDAGTRVRVSHRGSGFLAVEVLLERRVDDRADQSRPVAEVVVQRRGLHTCGGADRTRGDRVDTVTCGDLEGAGEQSLAGVTGCFCSTAIDAQVACCS